MLRCGGWLELTNRMYPPSSSLKAARGDCQVAGIFHLIAVAMEDWWAGLLVGAIVDMDQAGAQRIRHLPRRPALDGGQCIDLARWRKSDAARPQAFVQSSTAARITGPPLNLSVDSLGQSREIACSCVCRNFSIGRRLARHANDKGSTFSCQMPHDLPDWLRAVHVGP